VDPVSLVVNALTMGAAQGVTDSVSDAVKSAYSKLKDLVSAKLSGNKSGEVALAEHATDPETWQAPLTKALSASGAGADHAVVEAARLLMELLDPVGTRQGKYQVDVSGAHGVQVGDGNQQFNSFNMVAPPITVASQAAEIRPGQPRNEHAFRPAFDAAGGRARLGTALGEVYEDGPGWVQHFDGGSSGQQAVICAVFGHDATVVTQALWNVLARFGRGTYVSGTAAVGFPVASPERPFITDDGGPVELAGGKWGRGRLVPTGSGDWRWEPQIAFNDHATRDHGTWSGRHDAMDLRLRVAARTYLVAEGLRVTEAGRDQMLAELASTGLTAQIASLANRYSLTSTDLTWQETPYPEGYNTARFAAYQLIIPGGDGRAALLGSLRFMLPGERGIDVSSVVDLFVDFDAIQPAAEPVIPARVPVELQITAGELASFYTSAWQAAETLILTTGEKAIDVPPAGAPELELYIQNLHPEASSGPRALRIQEVVDLSVFGKTRNTSLGDLSVGVTAPLGLNAGEIGSLVRRAMIRMASDFGFTSADAAQILRAS